MLNLHAHNVRIGDTCRFPLGRLGSDEPVYRHRWAIYAFTRSGIVVRRLHDGVERTISAKWYQHYKTDDADHGPMGDQNLQRSEALATIRATRINAARRAQQADPTRPGFYVSASKGQQHVLLLGPFVDHYTALQVVRDAWPIVRRYDDPWSEVSVGTCRTDTSKTLGKFNSEVLG